MDQHKLIFFISSQLTIISKFKAEKDLFSSAEDFDSSIINSLFCINTVINNNNNCIQSYLVHQIPTILLSLYDINFEFKNHEIKECLNNIFTLLMENKHTIIYLCSTLDEESIKRIQIPLISANRERMNTWIQIYKKMNSFEQYDQVIDPITSCAIVIPCVIPMDNSGEMLQVCDKNMIMSCLWNKPENPFNRKNLTIEDLELLNKKQESVDKLKEFNKILKSAIEYSKN